MIETGGKQYRVEKGSTLLVDRLTAEEGDKVDLRPVAFRDKEMVLGKDLEKVKVEAKVAGHERGPKLRIFKYRPKKGYRRRAGHRSELTRLEITDVKMLVPETGGFVRREEGDRRGIEAGGEEGGRERWLIRKGSDRAGTAATPTRRCSGSRCSPGRR